MTEESPNADSKHESLPARLKKGAPAAFNIVKTIWPYLVSQSEWASQKVAQHQARLSLVEVAKERVQFELQHLDEARRLVFERMSSNSPLDRLSAQQSFDYVAQVEERLDVARRALEYIASPKDGHESEINEISPLWVDKFNELANQRNEEWRKDLLARALAQESETPESVGPKTLWMIGTLTEKQFYAFATFLDISTIINNAYAIPSRDHVAETFTSNYPVGNVTIGGLIYYLDDTGLFADAASVERKISHPDPCIAKYDRTAIIAIAKDRVITIRGVIPSVAGSEIANFCDCQHHPLGQKIFDGWLASIERQGHGVQMLPS